MRTEKEARSFKSKVTKERKRLVALYTDLSEDSMNRCEKLFDQMAFLGISIQELQMNIARDGTTTEYKNGEHQYGTKINPDVDTLNKYMQQYRHTKKAIDEEMPKGFDAPVDDGFDSFING